MKMWNISGISTVFVLFVTVLILLYLYIDWKFKYWIRRGIKSPTFFEQLKNLPKNRRKAMHEVVAIMYKQYGRFFGIYGPFPQLWIAEPDLIKQILVKDFHIFRNRAKFNFGEDIFRNMLSVLCDEDWKIVRSIMSPTFSSSKMRKMATLVMECSNNTSKFFCKMAEKDEEFDVKQCFGSFAVDVIATTAFATKINSLEDPNNEFLAKARMLSNRNVPVLKTLAVVMAPRLSKMLNIEFIPSEPIEYYKGIVMKILEEREKTKTKGYDFLQLMMDAKEGFIETSTEDKKEDNEEVYHAENRPKHKTMTIKEVISQCIMFFSAGHDTTAITLGFVAYQLALNPDCQEKLAKEIEATWEKHENIDFDIVSKMPYLNAVLCESLRINTTASMLMRLSTEDYAVGGTGIIIPKESSIIIPIHAMHHDPEWFPNPEKFDPDRFLPENKHLIKPFTYLPFGDGPRNCIGMRFITMIIKLCLAYMLKDIKFVATEETMKPLEYYSGQAILQAKRIPLKVVKR